jgi:hypothetical protein
MKQHDIYPTHVASGGRPDLDEITTLNRWIRENTTEKDGGAIIKWNNEMRGLRICDLTA